MYLLCSVRLLLRPLTSTEDRSCWSNIPSQLCISTLMVQFDIYAASIDAFREDGKSDLMNGRNPVVQNDYNDCFEVRNGLLYHLDFVGDVTGPFSAVLLRNKDKNLILNGDEGSVRFSVHGKSKNLQKVHNHQL